VTASRLRELSQELRALEERLRQGGGDPVVDVVDDAIEEALRQRVNVNVMYEEDTDGKIEGIACLLRFR
jgi:peptide subunit release factor 1 (eRF1)